MEHHPHISKTMCARLAPHSRIQQILLVILFTILNAASYGEVRHPINGDAAPVFETALVVDADSGISLEEKAESILSEISSGRKVPGIDGYIPVRVYTSHSLSDILLRKVSVELQGQAGSADELAESREYWYSARESAALSAGGLHELATWWLKPGTYSVKSKLVAEDDLETANVPRINVSKEISVNVGGPLYIEVSLDRQSSLFGLKEKSQLKVLSREATGPESHTVLERRVRYHALSGNELLASLLSRGEVDVESERHSITEEVVATASDNGTGSEGQAREAPGVEGWYRQYRSAMAELADGREPAALKGLVEIASAPVEDIFVDVESARLLQDRINVELGFYYLKTGRNLSAAQHFRVVRRFSPYAKKALIGLGWALLRPTERSIDVEGKPQADYLWSGSDEYVAWARRNAPYRNAWAVGSGEKLADLRNALSPWLELVAGNTLTAEVQEGLLVIPYALTHFGALDRAEERYRRADDTLLQASQRLSNLKAEIQQGKLVEDLLAYFAQQDSGWRDCLCGFERADEEALSLVIEAPAVMLELDALRQWTVVREEFRRYQQSLNKLHGNSISTDNGTSLSHLLAQLESLESHLTARIAQQTRAFNDVAEKITAEHIERTEAYLAESRFALARLNERRREQLLGYSEQGGER